MNLVLIAGARPNFMKIAPLSRALEAAGDKPRIIHTGQHYDARMSQTFFDELDIPHPDVNLGVGSGSAVFQITETMRRLESEFESNRPDVVIVVGDVNSTLAAAVTGNKLQIPVAHVEAGLRSFDRSMPEEMNRLMVDAIADWLFASEPSAVANLRREGVSQDRIHLVGNVMIDTLLAHLETARSLNAPANFGAAPGEYVLLTLHRPSNVDDPERLESILRAVREISSRFRVIFPVHPRTAGRMRDYGLPPEAFGIAAVEPQGYRAMLGLMDSARFVMTDSGGVQEETTALRVPCLTLRDNTERPATVEFGSNRLVGWRTDNILAAYEALLSEPERIGSVPEGWDGCAAERIARVLLRNPADVRDSQQVCHV